MITEEKAQELMIKLIDLRNKSNKDSSFLPEYRKHEMLCVDNFKYLIAIKTSRYKAFSNFDDLVQEGYEALCMAMSNYNPSKGSFFWWAHKYVDTRIARSANKHTTIRFPLKYAKENAPHKEYLIPDVADSKESPEKIIEHKQFYSQMFKAAKKLDPQAQQILELAYGFEEGKQIPVNKICEKLGISRSSCIKTIKKSLSQIKDNINV